MSTAWPLQDAKNNFSRLIKRAAEGEAQIVTVHGKPAAVIISTHEYEKLTCQAAGKLSALLLSPGIAGEDLEFSRDTDTGREITL